MAWNPRTWLFGETITAAKLNEIRDLLNACAPAKVSGAGQIPVATAANVLAGLAAPTASGKVLESDLSEDAKMKWGDGLSVYTVSQSSNLGLTNAYQDIPGISIDVDIVTANSKVIMFVNGNIASIDDQVRLMGVIDSIDQKERSFSNPNGNGYISYPYLAIATIASIGTVTIKLQGKQFSGTQAWLSQADMVVLVV